MKIRKLNVITGPNYWSVKRTSLIQMTLDIGIYEDLPSDKIPGFVENLVRLIPSLQSHRCSEGQEGGFISRMKQGTWLGHVIEHVALELQSLAGMECGFGRTRSTGEHGEYHVVFSFVVPQAGLYAAKSAVNLVKRIAENASYDIDACIQELRKKSSKELLGPSTQSIVNAAIKRGIPFTRLDMDSYIMFGYGKYQRRIQATVADSTSMIAVELVQDKQRVKQLLELNNIPVPVGLLVNKKSELNRAIAKFGYPLVIKPLTGNHGRGVTTNVINSNTALKALDLAFTISKDAIVERYITGDDYRFLVVNYKVVAVSKRSVASITGDGKSTIEELIELENRNPKRGDDHENFLTKIVVDAQTISLLQDENLTMDSILLKYEVLKVKYTANLSTGGTAEDVTDIVPLKTKLLMERTARLVGLDICGIDVMSPDIQLPFLTSGACVLEINAAPGFRMHLSPSHGKVQDVGEHVVSMLFPKDEPVRIPIVGITGTNGKTTTAFLLSHIASKANLLVGCSSTEGIFIDQQCVSYGDCSGPASAKSILCDPTIEYAVLECARGGILRAGLGFNHCDISIVTNLSEDHLGHQGIHTMEQLARVKQVLPEATREEGITILNADDDYVYQMRNSTNAQFALFSLSANNPRIISHMQNNGTVSYIDSGEMILVQEGEVVKILPVAEIPITMDGKYDCMIQNSMAAVLAAVASGFSMNQILLGLRTFLPSSEMNIGRMNHFLIDEVKVIVDYAHNVHGYIELKKYLAKVTAVHKIGIITGTGDRRDQDIISIGMLCSEIFDQIIIRHDEDSRGRSKDEITKLLLEGIRAIDSGKLVEVISSEEEALRKAIHDCSAGGLVFLSSDDSRTSIGYVEQLGCEFRNALKYYGT
ncbi:cyanophycin synthetase [Sphingobacterium sp. MYb382]|uniref:cyanophycin synthetase n=1 Tax=Sphingobacterium sp. MYb382 TaxID=2745278 RepID=UPI0030ABFF0B